MIPAAVALLETVTGPSAPGIGNDLAADAAAAVTGAANGGTLDTVTPFLNVGITGILLLMFVFRKGIVPEWTLTQAELRIEQLEAKIASLEVQVQGSTGLLIDQVVPLLTRAVDVEQEYLDQLDQLEQARGGRDERGSRTARPGRGR